MAWQIYQVLKRDVHSLTSAKYVRADRGRAFRFGELCFPISHEEERQLFRAYAAGSQPYELVWIVRKPGGSVFEKAHAVRFINKDAAILWQLGRACTLKEPEITEYLGRGVTRKTQRLIPTQDFNALVAAVTNPKPPSAKLVELVKKYK